MGKRRKKSVKILSPDEILKESREYDAFYLKNMKQYGYGEENIISDNVIFFLLFSTAIILSYFI